MARQHRNAHSRRIEAMIARLSIVAALSMASSDALAIVRYMVQGMTCAEVQEALNRDGIAILYRQAESGVALYDRFVKDESFCQALSTTASARISVADTNQCPVRKCIEIRRFGG
jgi:hypothetical protein